VRLQEDPKEETEISEIDASRHGWRRLNASAKRVMGIFRALANR
jgi:hypothetical protein